MVVAQKGQIHFLERSYWLFANVFFMFEKLKTILVDDMSVNETAITMDAELITDLGLNSLDLADLVMLC
jgi:hypothetical protein